ncbi:helix-turn-helix domain-containing protein [Roseateles sp. MS654]|uniref:helix-turn-helix domain-containing protein n=1 Tax=Roseateles sp. MS654 TaxID=3412685 RepID=UPI003C304E23
MHKSLYSRPNDVFLMLLRDVRTSKRLRQSDLAMRLGRSQAIVSRVESGERRLDITELVVWLAAMDTDIVTFAKQLHSSLEGDIAGTGRRRQKRLHQVGRRGP